MPRYIQVNHLKQTLREDLRIAHSWKVIFLWIPKLLRRRSEFTSCVPIPLPFQDFVVAAESISPEATAGLAQPLAEAAQLGFVAPVYQVIRTLAGESVTTAANCRHSGGEILGRLMHLRVGIVHPPKEKTIFGLISQLSDGRRLVTSSGRASFDARPTIIVQRQVGGSLEELLILHQAKLEELRSDTQPERLLDDAAMAALADRHEREAFEFHLRRGLYKEVSPEEVAAQSARIAAMQAVPGADATDRAVLTEIEKLQERRGSWKAALLIALLSFVAFMAIGGARWDWQFVFILTGVVAFHETGHYIAMRALRYKDVRMFFVPLLGAAVTGRHYNVKGWQRALVSLTGPVPGILIGLVLTAIALTTHNRLLERTALVTLLVNGINLLPLVPLDGGWVVHAILFSRHFVLETAFLGAAALGLIAATALGQSRLWMYLGILVLIGLPASYRLARVARRVRASGVPTASTDDQNIPPATALTILRELKQEQRATQLTRHLASQTLDVFQKLNATPPGVLASVVLLLAYLGAGTAAFMGVGAIFTSRAGLWRAQVEKLWPKPTRVVNPTEWRVAGTTNEMDVDWLAPTVLATFTNSADADAAFEAAVKQSELKDRIMLFGQSVFLSGPNASSNWTVRFKVRGAQVFLERPASNFTAIVNLNCQAPDDVTASAIQLDCDSYFSGLWLKTWPPWASLEGLEPDRVKAIESTRYTWTQLNHIDRIMSEDPEYRRTPERIRFSSRRWTRYEIAKIAKEKFDAQQAIYRRELNRLANSDDRRLDKELVALYDRYWFATNTNRDAAFKAVQEHPIVRLGCLPFEADLPANAQAWRACRSGDLERKQLELNFRFLVFWRTDLGLPAMVSYLQSKGCHHFRYEIRGSVERDEESVQSPNQ